MKNNIGTLIKKISKNENIGNEFAYNKVKFLQDIYINKHLEEYTMNIYNRTLDMFNSKMNTTLNRWYDIYKTPKDNVIHTKQYYDRDRNK